MVGILLFLPGERISIDKPVSLHRRQMYVRESLYSVKASGSHRRALWKTVRESRRGRRELEAYRGTSVGVRRTFGH